MRNKRFGGTVGVTIASTLSGQKGPASAVCVLVAVCAFCGISWSQETYPGLSPQSDQATTTARMAPAPLPQPGTAPTAPDAAAATVDPPASNLDQLLDLANNDIGRLTEVKVTAPALEVEVSTVTRQATTVGRTPAAVFVITREMIERSAARTIPDLLRMAPGVQVAQYHPGTWSVSVRGYNDQYSNKILVQVDGRSIYNPWWGGVWWNDNIVPLELIDRVEIVRGPGASVWGANAVNGVINIITKSTTDTQEFFVQGGGGSATRGYATTYQGGKLSENATYRVYGTWFDTQWDAPAGRSDIWSVGQGGARVDWRMTERDLLTLQGDYYDNQVGITDTSSLSFNHGGNVLSTWNHTIDDDTDWTLRTYYDNRCNISRNFSMLDSKFDVDYTLRFRMGERHRMVAGFEYRNTRTLFQTRDGSLRQYGLADDMYDYFLQDEIMLVEDRLYFTAGCKFNHQIFTSFEFQPTGRILFLPDDKTSVWASLSRAVRLPTRWGLINGPAWNPMDIHNVRAEKLMAWEIGMRRQETERFAWDFATFLYDYHDLVSSTGFDPFNPMGAVFANDMTGESYGFEIAADYELTPRWRLRGNYSMIRMALHGDARPAASMTATNIEGLTPQNQFNIQSSWDLFRNVQLDATWRYVDRLATNNIPSYNVADVRLAWTPRKNLEFEVVGRNLLRADHFEFGQSFFGGVNRVPTEVYGGVTWRR